jgi:chemotaxis-related protein WspB
VLFLVFHLDNQRYALEAGQITEVLPLVDVRLIPHAPPEVAGVFNFHGVPVPVIDLSQLALGRPAVRRLSTRLVILGYADGTGERRSLGVIVERVTQTVQREPADFIDCGVTTERASYLGAVANDEDGLLQRIDVSRLLPAHVREVLYRASVERPWTSPTSTIC